ncbi:MAG: redoxin domain-containing protein [Pirellulaceae bacterium]
MVVLRVVVFLFVGIAVASHVMAQDDNPQSKVETLVETLTGRHGEIQVHKISLSGTAKNQDGEPVAGATIIVGYADLNRAVGKDEAGETHEFPFELARVKSDQKGRFAADDLIVPAKIRVGNNPESAPLQAELQLIGIADNYGLTWSKPFAFRPGKRTVRTFEDEEGVVYFSGEPIEIALSFPASVPLHGTVTDQAGNPIAGAVVRAGQVNDSDDASDDKPRMTIFNFTENSPNAGLGYPRMHLVPEEIRTTKTNAKGEYRFDSIPYGVRMGVSFSHPSFLSHVLKSFNTSPGEKRGKFIGADYELSPAVDLGQTIALQAVDPKTKSPVPGAKFEILYSRNVQQDSVATANEDGVASLRVLPGSYSLRIVPPPGNKYWVTTDILNVAEGLAGGDPLAWELTPARSIACKVVAGDKPVAGISLEFSTDGVIWKTAATQGSYTEYSSTDQDGILNLVVPADAQSIRIQGDDQIKQEIGSESELLFNADATMAAIDSRKVAYLDTVRPLSGTYRYRSNNHLKKKVSAKDFRDKIESLVDKDAKLVEEVLHAYFGELPLSDIVLTQSGTRRRVESKYAYGDQSSTDWTVSDGQNRIRFGAANRQCNVELERNSRMHMPGISSLVQFPMELDPTEAIREGDRLVLKKDEAGQSARVEQDAESGFVYVRESLYGRNGQSSWQIGKREINGQVLPRIRVEGRYRDDQLDYAKVLFLDDIQLSDQIPIATFAMNLPAGTNVFDYRSIDPNAVSSRGKFTGIKTDCVDLIAWLGEPAPAIEAMKYGDPAPKLQIQNWIRGGRTIEAPDLKGKRLLLFFMGADQDDFVTELPALRRASEAFADEDSIAVIAVFSPPQSASSLAKLSIVRDLNCIVAVDSQAEEGRHQGATRAAYPGYSSQFSVVIDPQGNVQMFASYNDNIDSTTRWIERSNK